MCIMSTGNTNSGVSGAVAAFRELHESGCFVIPNPWDRGSAVYLQQLGFKALATTSGGFAFSRGVPDEESRITRDAMLAHFRDIVDATSLPVNGDFQSGYADDPDGVAGNVALCVQTGVAGLSIEDATGRAASPLYEFKLAAERIKAARAAIDRAGVPVVLTARCEAWVVRAPNPARTAIDRLVAFADSGADCLFAPGVTDTETIASIVKAVAPKPVNVLVSSPVPGLSVPRLAGLGVRRISVGSALARVAWGAFAKSARNIADAGSFETFAQSFPYDTLNGLFR
jgi:2-methylisocitrate lyase-like PEP mutase family enzyme